jgi:hypothetical protein
MMLRRVAFGVVVMWLIPAGAFGSRPSAQLVKVRPHYRIVGHDGVATDGRYTMVWRLHGAVIGTMIDERTGRQVLVRTAPGCSAPVSAQPVFGDSWLEVDCSRTRLELYSLSRQLWSSVAVRGPCRGSQLPGGNCDPVAIGTDWIKYDRATVRHGDQYFFQNIKTGRVQVDPSTAHVRADLDWPALARRVCAPLRNPADGTLTFDSGVVLAVDDQGGAYLRRCGTSLRLLAGRPPLPIAIGPSEVIYDTSPHGTIHAISLPTLQRSSITLPAEAFDVIGVAVGDAHIYVEAQTHSGRYDVWSAPTSRPPLK